ncbi:MAG: FtsX-like permease family protein [Cyclobacteriaceae bacterium]
MQDYKNRPSPPPWSTRFLAWFIKEDYYEDIQGDLEEEFQLKAEGSTLLRARYWYRWQIMRLFRPAMMKRLKPQDSIEKETTMFKNYLKIGFRNLWKYKSSTAINIVGLSTGLAAFVLISLFLKDEISYDKHFENVEEIHRVTVKNYTVDGDVSRQWAFASAGHAKRLKEDYSDITHAVRFYPWAFPDIVVEDKTLRGEAVIFAGDDVFDVFSFKFIEGNAETAFDDLYSLVLTEATAIKLYGNDWRNQNILGSQLKLERGNQEAPFKVTGVMEDMPDQQHFHFDYLAPIRFIEMLFGEDASNNVGGNYNWLTYVRISGNANIPELTKSVNDEFWDKYIGTTRSGAPASNFYDFEFQPILDIHLTSNLEGEYENNGSIQQVYIFGIVGILLLLVACVNYMNIATSHYSRRMKEVGVRKVIGAFKTSLVKQFLTESTLITVISLPICVLLILWALPYLNNFMEKSIAFNPFTQLGLLGSLLLLLLGVGLIAGLYPALFLSKVNLVQALKGEQSMNSGKWNFRSWLVAFQYTVTIALIFSIAVIESQMQFIRNSNPGYNREQVLNVNIRPIANLETFKNELLSSPNIEKASYSSRIPTGRLADSMGSNYFMGDSAVASGFRLPYIRVDKDFLDTYEIELVAGENFREGMQVENMFDRDSSGNFITASANYIINETAAKSFGYENPADILGTVITYGPSEGRIIGIMKDFHFESLHSTIAPMLLMYRENYRRLSLKISGNNLQNTLDFIERTWGDFEKEIPINYTFLDESFNDQYRQEERLSSMIKVFAVIAIIIGCLGLIGMVGFIIETKLKEIGIRKVLGASTQSIWLMVSNRFLILVGIAFIVALPISYYLMDGWLDEFVYRTRIGAFIIFLPVVLSVALTLIAISYQTIKATLVNPVECLKDE